MTHVNSHLISIETRSEMEAIVDYRTHNAGNRAIAHINMFNTTSALCRLPCSPATLGCIAGHFLTLHGFASVMTATMHAVV